jgi:predicted nucleic acid-binding protein
MKHKVLPDDIQHPVFLVDSNVILDVLLDRKDKNTQWSVDTLNQCYEHGNLAINQIIYTEVAGIFSNLPELEDTLASYYKFSLPWEAGFIASKAYLAYKRNGGKRSAPLPDFYIGAHAIFSKLALVTRDKGYKTYFPNIKLITPPN